MFSSEDKKTAKATLLPFQIVEKVIFRQSGSLREARADEEKAAVVVRGYDKRLLTK